MQIAGGAKHAVIVGLLISALAGLLYLLSLHVGNEPMFP